MKISYNLLAAKAEKIVEANLLPLRGKENIVDGGIFGWVLIGEMQEERGNQGAR